MAEMGEAVGIEKCFPKTMRVEKEIKRVEGYDDFLLFYVGGNSGNTYIVYMGKSEEGVSFICGCLGFLKARGLCSHVYTVAKRVIREGKATVEEIEKYCEKVRGGK